MHSHPPHVDVHKKAACNIYRPLDCNEQAS